ncbi:MAG: hypothetical protein M3R59_07815 [Verrucomicrobiota bacterium]|nr:hypothetical protein [Verrucomicrobiota bacterium]
MNDVGLLIDDRIWFVTMDASFTDKTPALMRKGASSTVDAVLLINDALSLMREAALLIREGVLFMRKAASLMRKMALLMREAVLFIVGVDLLTDDAVLLIRKMAPLIRKAALSVSKMCRIGAVEECKRLKACDLSGMSGFWLLADPMAAN